MRAGRISAVVLVAGSVLAPAALAASPALAVPAAPPASTARTVPAALRAPAAQAPLPVLAAPAARAVHAAPAALADATVTSFGFSVTPSTVAPGDAVTLQVTQCDKTATASAPALFDDTTLSGSGSTKSATVRVGADAKPGAQYDVTFTCGAESGTTPVTISDPVAPLTPATPGGAVGTGLGGSVSGPNAAEVALGVALACAAAASFLVRRAVRTARTGRASRR